MEDQIRREIPPGSEHHAWLSPTSPHGPQPWLVVVSGWTGAGKSTMADLIAAELGATVASFDWVMSGLRAIPEVWSTIELPVEDSAGSAGTSCRASLSSSCAEGHHASWTSPLARSHG